MAGFGEYGGGGGRYARPLSFPGELGEPGEHEARYRAYSTPLAEELAGPPLLHDDPDDDDTSAIVTTGVSVASLITENLLSHPFIVLRRQCQVHNTLRSYHIVPYTLLPVIARLHRRQDVTTLWKGIGSTCIVKGINMGVDDLISKATNWPKEIDKCHSVLQFLQHIVLKTVSIAIATPFYSASLVETVQSDIASDKPGILDVFREGAGRLLEWGCPSKGRMLPIWAIVMPTAAYGISKYIMNITLRCICVRVLRFQQRHRYELNDSYPHYARANNNPILEDVQLKANMFAFVVTEIAFYPVETIIHRLHIQGTRTIIDNLENGTSVLPILTGYEGFFDCYHSTLAKEGVGGLYKGFGALVLQLCAHLAIIKLTTWVCTEVAYLLKPATKSPSDSSIHSQQKYLFN